jgi:thiamine-phosphate pyrophosphorylase
VEDCARAGADFVAVRDVVWDHLEGPAVAVAEVNAVLDRVAEETDAPA